VHGRERDTTVAELSHRGRDGGGHIEELEVDEHALVACNEPVEQVEVAARHAELEADLVELDRVVEPFDQPRAWSTALTSSAKINLSPAGISLRISDILCGPKVGAALMIPERGQVRSAGSNSRWCSRIAKRSVMPAM
jgi:hypothetical protein